MSINGKKSKETYHNVDQSFTFFNETKMRQKLKKEWLQLANKYQSELDLDFIDNSIDNILQDSKIYLNSSNILPNIENNANNYNNNEKNFPMINKKDNFYQSLNSNFLNDKNFNKNNFNNQRNLSQINFIDSNNNFYIKENAHRNNFKKTQKLNFNSIYAYNLKSENDLVEKIRSKDKENYLNNNNLFRTNLKFNANAHYNQANFNETGLNSHDYEHSSDNKNITKMKNTSNAYIVNNNNLFNNQNELSTLINLYNYNNSAGFKFNSSGENAINPSINLAYVKLDIYDLGQLLLYSVLGGYELIDLSSYECLHSRPENCCCLMHCYFKYETENKKHFKLKLSEMFKKFGLSFNFENFICTLTSYKFDKNLSIEILKEHFWLSEIKNKKYQKNKNLKEREDNSNVNFQQYISKNLIIESKEVFKLSNEINSKGSVINNGHVLSKKYEKFFENFNNILPKSINYFKHYNYNNFLQILNKNEHLDYIAKEMNLDKDYMLNRFKTLFDNFFLSTNFSKND